MAQDALFPLSPPTDTADAPAPKRALSPKAAPRVQRPERRQVELRAVDLEGLLPPDHPVRAVWAFASALDLSPLYDRIRALEGEAGRAPIDPAILMALWLYATIKGVGSARALDELCVSHHAYQWLCGGVSVNYHTLADFRTAHAELLEAQLTGGVATLMNEGLVELERVAQDGVRVRASAGAASFRRKETLERCLEQAEEQVAALRRELEDDPGATRRRQRAAQERAAQDRVERVKAALEQLPSVEAKKKESEREKARVSTTDPEARVMKMGDGGFRPAYNVQFATDTGSQVIVGVAVTNEGSDLGQMVPMVEQIVERCGETPDDYLVDGGFAKREAIEAVAGRGVTVYAPVSKPKDKERDPFAPLPTDSKPVAEWRARMGTEDAQAIYKERAATAECVNAIARQRGLILLRVRGKKRVLAAVLWFALAHNMMRTFALRAAAAAV